MKRLVITIAALVIAAPFALAQQVEDPQATDDDSDALFASPSGLTQQTGEGIYNAVCAGCHMPDGQGAVGAGAYPPLADNPNLAFPEYAIYVTIHGQGAMPPLGGILEDEQIATLMEYIRTSFGNDYPEPVTAEMVENAR